MPEAQPALTGVVKSFMPAKGFGFIQGDDGKSYFVHQNAVTDGSVLADGQKVAFEGEPSPKGYRALRVVPGEPLPPPTTVYSEPDSFVWARSELPRGMAVVFWISDGAWAESRRPAEARDMLTRIARQQGANAVVNVRTDTYSAWGGGNYYYTMHRFVGDTACVMRVKQSTDPEVIARSDAWHEEMQVWLALNPPIVPAEDPGMSLKALLSFAKVVAMMVWGWTVSLSKILYAAITERIKKPRH